MNGVGYANFILDILDRNAIIMCDLIEQVRYLEAFYRENDNRLLTNEIGGRFNQILDRVRDSVDVIEFDEGAGR